MDELIAFLRAALDEDERLALRLPDHRLYVCDDGHIEEPIGKWADGDDRLPNHHNTWLPMYDRSRVLAEVQAKRQRIDWIEGELADDQDNETAQWLAKLEAQPYAGQPGWREEWQLSEPA